LGRTVTVALGRSASSITSGSGAGELVHASAWSDHGSRCNCSENDAPRAPRIHFVFGPCAVRRCLLAHSMSGGWGQSTGESNLPSTPLPLAGTSRHLILAQARATSPLPRCTARLSCRAAIMSSSASPVQPLLPCVVVCCILTVDPLPHEATIMEIEGVFISRKERIRCSYFHHSAQADPTYNQFKSPRYSRHVLGTTCLGPLATRCNSSWNHVLDRKKPFRYVGRENLDQDYVHKINTPNSANGIYH